MKNTLFAFLALIFSLFVFAWFYYSPLKLALDKIPDPLPAAIATNSLTTIKQAVRFEPEMHQSHLHQLAKNIAKIHQCPFFKKACKSHYFNKAFDSLKNWGEDFRNDLSVQYKAATSIFVLAKLSEQYGLKEPAIFSYARDYSRAILTTYPEDPLSIQQAIFIQSHTVHEPETLKTLIGKCLALEAIKGYCQSIN